MTAANFPDSPSVGDVFIVGSSSYEWNGSVWLASRVASIEVEDVNGLQSELNSLLQSPTIINPSFSMEVISSSINEAYPHAVFDDESWPLGGVNGQFVFATTGLVDFEYASVFTTYPSLVKIAGSGIDDILVRVISSNTVELGSLIQHFYKFETVNLSDVAAVNAWSSTLPSFASGVITFNIFADTDSDSNIGPSSIRYLGGLTSNVQNQLDGKLSTLVSAPAFGDILFYNGNWVNAKGLVLTSQNIVSNTAVTSNKKLFVNTAAARTLTFPASPSLGDEIQVFDATGTAGTNNITIANNGNKINGVLDSAILDVNGVAASFVWTGSTYGWRMG